MEQTIQALGGVLLKAIPTVGILIFLHFYLKFMLFKPLERVLKQRAELTEGTRKAAEQSLVNAERKQREYEAKFRDARSDVYRLQEETRRRWLDDQSAQVAEARLKAETAIRVAKEQIAVDAAAARQGLIETSAQIADQIANRILGRRAA